MDTETKQQFEKIDQRLEKLINTINQRFEEVNGTLYAFFEEFARINTKLEDHDERFDQQDTRFDTIDKQITLLRKDTRIDRELAQERDKELVKLRAKQEDEAAITAYRMSCHDRDIGAIQKNLSLTK